jgi:DNA-binding LacI/PurR family transcriptional regulator
VVNHSARTLVTRRANCIALVISEQQDRLFEDPNYNVLIRSASQAVAKQDMSLIMIIASDIDDRERVLRYAKGGHVDGVILVSTHRGDPFLAELESSPIPTVACGRPLGHETAIPYVAADDREGARQMVRQLQQIGRRRIATIAGPADTPGGVDRLQGYRDIVGRRGTKRLISVTPDFSFPAGEAAMEELLAASPDLDAVFVASDLLAAGAMATLRRRGRRVPDDVAVGGFDDSNTALATDPPLTTIRQPLAQVSTEMVQLLLRVIDGEEVESVILPTELVVRGTA